MVPFLERLSNALPPEPLSFRIPPQSLPLAFMTPMMQAPVAGCNDESSPAL
jgi:hypothetical protein